MKKRLQFVYLFVTLMLLTLSVRLVFIQIVDGKEYAEAAQAQYKIGLEGSDARGIIYDRNLNPLTGTEADYVYIIERNRVDSRVSQIFESLGGRRVPSKNKTYSVFSSPIFSDYATSVLKEEYKAFVLESQKRYATNQSAVHLIGYVNEVDGKGAFGIEKDYDEELTKRVRKISGTADATGKILQGKGIRVTDENKKSGVITTLDGVVQKKAEQILSQADYNGAIIVADAVTGDILASASSPFYNPTAIEKYLTSDKMELINKSTQGQYAPGSVFKIIVAAAALEEGIITADRRFQCNGYEVINGVQINCSARSGHGELDFKNAFAKSCNSAFIQLGKELGGEKILKMANRFHLNEMAINDITDQRSGIFPNLADIAGAGIGNLSIGQGKLALTPMEVTRSTMIIANGGWDQELSLIKGTYNQNEISYIPKGSGGRVIEEVINKQILDAMVETAVTGTARSLNINDGEEKISVAAKTGSAETTMGGEYVVHSWLTGFLPAEDPRYVITVFMEKGGSGRGAAIPAFQNMAQSLYEK